MTAEPEPCGDGMETPELERRLDALSKRIGVLEEQNEWLEEQLKERDEEIETLRERIDELEDRSQLLDRVLDHGPSSRKKRAALLLQVLYNDAISSNGKAAMDVNAGLENLNRQVDRTTVYGIFDEAVDAVGDEDVCYVIKESRASKKNTRLVLEPDEGTVPEKVGGVPLKGGAD